MKPERILTQKEWDILEEAALEIAAQRRYISGEAVREKDLRTAKYWAKKSKKIMDVLASIEDEYYEHHPEKDPDKKENTNGN